MGNYIPVYHDPDHGCDNCPFQKISRWGDLYCDLSAEVEELAFGEPAPKECLLRNQDVLVSRNRHD